MLAPLRLVFVVTTLSFAAVACSDGDGAPAPPRSNDRPADAPKVNDPAPPTSGSPPPPALGGAPGTLATTPCRFIVPKSVEGKTFSCADLTVLENRRNAGSTKVITLHVAIIKGKPGGVPTIELIGGPGAGSEDLAGSLVAGRKSVAAAYAPILAKGDLVLFDQRGIGRSIPRLACSFDGADPITSCKTALEAKGIDLAAYDTVENADDVHDLKVALGVPKIDLHGISYGTRLGLEIMKRHPDDVRAAIIDGVMPPDVPIMGMFPIAVDRILTRVFDACKADTKCNATYPDLDAKLVQLKAKLDATPFKVTDPQLGTYDYDWYAFNEELMQSFYVEGTGELLPRLITRLLAQTQEQFQAKVAADAAADEAKYALEAAEDAKNPLAAELADLQQTMTEEDFAAASLATGMYLSVTCNDYAQHETLASSRAAQSKIRAVLRDDDALEAEFADCKSWPIRPSEPSALKAATFAGPVLVIGGNLDPATPVEWAKHAAATLPARQLVEVPTGGHGQMDACGAGLKGAFFADTSKPLDATCATNRVLAFAYDAAAAPKARAVSGSTRVDADRTYPPARPAASQLERIANRAALAARPSVLNDISRRIHRTR